MQIRFESLSQDHADRLLRFEQENREWFESLIVARATDFYTLDGVMTHIDHLVQSTIGRKTVALLALTGPEIIARANLKAICADSGTAEVGYRVSNRFIGNGVGTACLAELIRRAEHDSRINSLRAKVLDNNPASRRMLDKLGFSAIGFEPAAFQIGSETFGLTTLELLL